MTIKWGDNVLMVIFINSVKCIYGYIFKISKCQRQLKVLFFKLLKVKLRIG